MSKTFPSGEHTVNISLSRYRAGMVGHVVYQASVTSSDGAYSHFGDDSGLVREWMDRRDRPRETVSDHETRERGVFRISVDDEGYINILSELDEGHD